MNRRQIKKFCKKGGHYHFDKTIKRMSHKRLMHPYITRAMFGHMVNWYEIGTCITCEHCTDVMVDWDGTPYAYYSTAIGCGGCGINLIKTSNSSSLCGFVQTHPNLI